MITYNPIPTVIGPSAIHWSTFMKYHECPVVKRSQQTHICEKKKSLHNNKYKEYKYILYIMSQLSCLYHFKLLLSESTNPSSNQSGSLCQAFSVPQSESRDQRRGSVQTIHFRVHSGRSALNLCINMAPTVSRLPFYVA